MSFIDKQCFSQHRDCPLYFWHMTGFFHCLNQINFERKLSFSFFVTRLPLLFLIPDTKRVVSNGHLKGSRLNSILKNKHLKNIFSPNIFKLHIISSLICLNLELLCFKVFSLSEFPFFAFLIIKKITEWYIGIITNCKTN